MSKIDLRIRNNNKLYSIVLDDYRIGGCKWNDIEHGKCIEFPVNKEDVFVALGVDKTIANLQSQLDQAKSEIIKYNILLNDMETENSHLETMLDQANEMLKGAIIPKFKIGQEVWYISQNNDNVYEFMIKEMVFTRCKDEREMIVYYDEYCAQMYEYELYSSKEEAQAKLQELQNGDFQGE